MATRQARKFRLVPLVLLVLAKTASPSFAETPSPVPRTPIFGSLPEGKPPTGCVEAPDLTQVLRALPPLFPNMRPLYEEHRDDIDVIVERIVDRVDPPRWTPLIGMAQMHHVQWKCTIYFTEIRESSLPFPFRVHTPRIHVVMIERDHLHLCAAKEPVATREHPIVSGVRVDGNESVSACTLQAEAIWPKIYVYQDYSPPLCDMGSTIIVDYYRGLGFLKASASCEQVWSDHHTRVALLFHVQEGVRSPVKTAAPPEVVPPASRREALARRRGWLAEYKRGNEILRELGSVPQGEVLCH